ncbi:hypothetical protein [Chloroflexus sp.]|uniref:hypothetical protein n=1 Tax=Chloroflexus sp. TaxID=1904827 RepID=UPI002ACE19C1|nr:hypothetical protein [Chloroflexus sp.]
MTTMRNGSGTPAVVPELGPVGRDVMLRLLQQREDEPVHALAGMLANAYGALVGGDFDTARKVLGDVMAPALDMERALTTLQRANAEAQDAAAALAEIAPAEIDADVAFSGPQLETWREALEASIAAQMELIERLKILQQLAQAAAPEPVGA